jgi:hypothetical protein
MACRKKGESHFRKVGNKYYFEPKYRSDVTRSLHSWARNLKNNATQKQNAICKTRAQYAKDNCAFELFKAHCAATINAKNASFHKKILKCKERNLLLHQIRNFLVRW